MSRHVWRRLKQRLPPSKDFKADLAAGSAGGIAAIPDGLAAAVITGVNPIHGVYAAMVGRIVGGLSTASALMCVTTTAALSITAASAMSAIPEDQQAGALALLVLIAGLVQLGMGLLRLGLLVNFVSNTVTVGFLGGVATTIVLSQLGELVGYHSDEDHRLAQVYDLFTNLGQIEPQTLLIGALTLVAVVALDRTRLANVGMILAIILAGLVTYFLGLDDVVLVGDVYTIPASLPLPILPNLSFLPDVTTAGVAVGIVGLLQAAAVSHSYPNPDGRYPNMSGDFRGQGLANIACALLRGLPVGGSVGQTALLVHAGSRSRWATIISGLVTAVSILLFAPLVELLPMTAVAALLVVVGVRAMPVELIQTIWQSGPVNTVVMAMTFAATLILPIEQAVMLGVIVTFTLQIFRAADRLQLLQLIPRNDGLYDEQPAPKQLPSRRITVLYPNGSLFFAGARLFESELPDPQGTQHPIVILLLRGRKELGSTFLGVTERYAEQLRARKGKLILVGASDRALDQLRRTGLMTTLGLNNVYAHTPVVGEALHQAYADAETWLGDQNEDNAGEDEA